MPPAPTGLAILSENSDAHTVEISWNNPSTNTRNSPDFYVIDVRTSETEEYVMLDEEIPVSSYAGYTVTRLFSGYQNFFTLRGSNLGGLGDPSNEVNVTLSTGIPRIRSVSVAVLSSTSLNVSYQLWHDGGSRLTAVMVGYKENSSDVWNNITESFLDKNATYYVIIADLTSATYYNVSYPSKLYYRTMDTVTRGNLRSSTKRSKIEILRFFDTCLLQFSVSIVQ